MDSLRAIKNRIKSIKNTSQITKAMEMVAASKMRKAQEFAINTRFYAIKALELITNLSSSLKDIKHYLLDIPESERVCFLVVTSDKGLCGGYNSTVLNAVLKFSEKYDKKNIDIIAVGKKGSDFLKGRRFNIAASFSGFGDYVELDETTPVARILVDYQKEGRYKEVFIFYNKFISTLKQKVFSHKILPFDFDVFKEISKEIIPETGRYSEFKKEFAQAKSTEEEYILEPSADKIADVLLPSLFEIQIHCAIMESNAAEHSARMVAMKSASDNAKDIMEDLKLIYNKARQANITKELSEISAGAEALK